MRATPKQLAARDREWLDYQGTLFCWACDAADGTVVGAHVRTGECAGLGRKPDDRLVVPLCFRCHADQEATPGADWWLVNVFKHRLKRRYERWRSRT